MSSETEEAGFSTGLAVNGRRCREPREAPGCVVHVFSCRESSGGGGRWKQAAEQEGSDLYFKCFGDRFKT